MLRCPYCGVVAVKTQTQWGTKYECAKCDARVGCHKGTDNPLGTMANAELRTARMQAHVAFDALWKVHGIPRREAYAWLGGNLRLKQKECHIGRFTMAQCAQTVQLAHERIASLTTNQRVAQ